MIYSLFTISLLLRSILYPIFRLAALFSPQLKERFIFEDKNFEDKFCQGLKRLGTRAHITFHFSSEGELELIRPIIDVCLNKKQKIELIFTSPSVERQVMLLASLYPEQINYLRMPLLSFCFAFFGQNPMNWISSNKLLMVRYDFFPELLVLKKSLQKLVLFAASSKSRSNLDWRFRFKKKLYMCFDEIFPSTNNDFNFFTKELAVSKINTPIDIRSIQIFKRQTKAELYVKRPELMRVFNLLPSEQVKTKIILAQMWPSEMSIFKNEEFLTDLNSGKTFTYLAPHKFETGFVKALTTYLDTLNATFVNSGRSNLQINYYLISGNKMLEDIEYICQNFANKPGPIISLVPGILCEIYPHFEFAYVGGGFGKGVHSLLEPFVGGCTLACGPNTYRSTEFDIIDDLGHKIRRYMHHELVQFYGDLSKRERNLVDVSSFIEQNEFKMQNVLKSLGII